MKYKGNAKIIPANPEAIFLPFQSRWITDNSRLKLMEKSRQIGISWSTAYAADETVFAYRPKSGDYYRALVATGQALAVDSPLTSNGAGLLVLATPATDVVICYADEAITTTATTAVAVKFK